MSEIRRNNPGVSRREFIRAATAGAGALLCSPILGCATELRRALPTRGPAAREIPLNQDWLFGGKFTEASAAPDFDDSSFTRVTLPHCVSTLSWQKWDPAQWQDVWIYRRHFSLPELTQRIFLRFEGVMTGATPVLNGQPLPQHLGGYLPFEYEVTSLVRKENTLALKVDSRWLNVPPEGAPEGPKAVDYLQPGGITRSVTLRIVPSVFIRDVFAKPVSVLNSSRRVDVECTLDVDRIVSQSLRLQVELLYQSRRVSRISQPVTLDSPGQKQFTLTLRDLGNIHLWDLDSPHLYEVVSTLFADEKPVHEHRTRIGFREVSFQTDGFFLNGRRVRLFGLNRHEIYPYAGGAMPSRVLRRDAEILRREFNCNIVRCSHYPQSEAFLDACDELGLMVWEEIPGWWYVGDQPWKDLAMRDVADMIRRDRNRPSVIIWGVRINESPTDLELYRRTTELAKSLDASRPASGSMTPWSRKNWKQEWHEDVFAFDDYHAEPDGSVGIEPPTPGVPYMLAEAVGQCAYGKGELKFNAFYRRAGDVLLQEQQALRHAQAHDRAARYPQCSGVIAWCGFDYGSLINGYNAVKCPGVADVFRIPKLGAAFYQSQCDPAIKPVIEPDFYWNFGDAGTQPVKKHVAIFSNCEHLQLFIDGKPAGILKPDRTNFPNLPFPPFLAEVEVDPSARPDLRIDGYLNGKLVLSRRFSSDETKDKFLLNVDDVNLTADGRDATRLYFARVDRFGSIRPVPEGEISFSVAGPATLIGDNPFKLADTAGTGAVWIRTIQNAPGHIRVTGRHSAFGSKTIRLRAV